MFPVPAPSLPVSREEWSDADFDLTEGQPFHSLAEKEDAENEDWDVEMNLGPTGGATIFNIRRPPPSIGQIDNEDEDEGVSTIKVTALPKPLSTSPHTSIDDDFEDAFALPSDLTQLSLAPLSLNHRSSKSSLEWGGDKDHTSSSQSSDAYSSFGFADASPSSISASSAPPDTETDDDDDEGELEGLVLPTDIFESNQGGRKLSKLLELKRAARLSLEVKVARPDPEDDFEMGLVIDDDADFSPSRLLNTVQHKQASKSLDRLPSQRQSSLRPASRMRLERAKSPSNPPMSSAKQLQRLRFSPPPPLPLGKHPQPFPSPSPSPSFLSPKAASLRGQKSHSGLKPPTPATTTRRLTRKASLSSLMETSQSLVPSGSGAKPARYEEPTAASRAKSQKNSLPKTEYKVPPTRPSTPSTNSAALRLTMPTRVKSRPALSSIFSATSTASSSNSGGRAVSPVAPRPPSSLAKPSRSATIPSTTPPKILKRPKKPRMYGDGTELDAIEDLPTDRDKESRFRVQPKGFGNRIPGGSYPAKAPDKGTLRRKSKREVSSPVFDMVPSSATGAGVKRNTRPEPGSQGWITVSPKRKKKVASPNSNSQTRRKPTLIRNLGGTSGEKVVGGMKWNPQSLRWEGNEHVLREFDAVVASTRPALITHLTGSSIGSPVSSFATGARMVGHMIFDPSRMCWISTLPPEEDEPDVFANLADDEDDSESWDSRGGTIRALVANAERPPSRTISPTIGVASPARSHLSDASSDRGSRASMVYDIDNSFLRACKEAEERHQAEMKGWSTNLSRQSDVFMEPDRSYLYEIRALATRQY